MIERIFIDNFRCLVNCEVRLAPVSLLLGGNGSGKSSVCDALAALQRFIGGEQTVVDAFPSAALTRWQSIPNQTFEIDLRHQRGLYQYRLALEQRPERSQCRVREESLTLEGHPLIESHDGELQLFNDFKGLGPKFSYDWTRTIFSFVNVRNDNQGLFAFRQWITSGILIRPCAPLLVSDSPEESERLTIYGQNFASWYRSISRQDIARQSDLFRSLSEVIDGFSGLLLDGPADSTLTLRVKMRQPGASKPIVFKLAELSDGQKQLIMLYTILLGIDNEAKTLFFDEPENFLALREIEPWLSSLADAVGRSVGQAILISHHPEMIDRLARDKGVWFSRENGGPTRVEYGKVTAETVLRPSEVVARGWQ